MNQDIKEGIVREPLDEYKTSLRVYPDAKLLKRERKVINRAQKEKILKGTKGLTKVKSKVTEVDTPGIVNNIICGDSVSILKEFALMFSHYFQTICLRIT